MFAALQVADHIVADGVGQGLRREEESHAHRPLRNERRDQVGVFRRHRGRRNLGRVLRVIGLTGVRKPIFRASDRPDDRGDGAETCRRAGPIRAILHRLSVGLAAVALAGHQLIVVIIENDDLAFDLIGPQGLQFVEVSNDDHFGRQPGRRRSHTRAEGGQNNFLGRVRRHPWKFDQRSGLFAANPMRHGHFLEPDLETERFQLSRDIFDGLFRLRGAGQARADVIREMGRLPPGIIALERGLLELFQFRQAFFRNKATESVWRSGPGSVPARDLATRRRQPGRQCRSIFSQQFGYS